jgi:hypothetical protein
MIRSALATLAGLFVDDGSFALALAVLIAILTLSVRFVWISPLAGSLVLLAGCILLLVESVFRAARRKRAGRG